MMMNKIRPDPLSTQQRNRESVTFLPRYVHVAKHQDPDTAGKNSLLIGQLMSNILTLYMSQYFK
jgi:hypothetical protein